MATAFLYSGGSFTRIDVPGATATNAYGINDAGQIVGAFYDGTTYHSFLYSGGSFTQIDPPGARYTEALDINDAGQIVGYFLGSDSSGFLYSAGSFTQIHVPGASLTAAYGINDAGQIVGWFLDIPDRDGPDSDHGFLATATGDPHFTTYDGVKYDYQGLGDFVLTRSAVDPFEVQVRTRLYHEGSSATIMSQAAATLCGHVVTFDIDRVGGSFVSLDGSPMPLSIGNPFLTADGCVISALSEKGYQVAWNTGEILEVTDKGKYLNLSSELSWISQLSPMEGLLSSKLDPDRWRVTGADSLFNPVPEPSTLTLLIVGIGFTVLCMMSRRAVPPMVNRSGV
ncbi:MAG TPA: VWD domain-containing protein [Terriglobales bacterium]|nr:VWD domain-containing protein [Terriglobales bacterium]